MNRSGVLRGIGIWLPTVVLGLFFVMQGLMKFDPGTGWGQRFTDWGFPNGFHLVIGVVELLGGIMLFVPRLASYAGLALGGVMLGALAIHMIHVELPNILVTLVLSLAFLALARARWERRWFASVGPTMEVDGRIRNAE